MWSEWSPLKKLIWLRRVTSGASYILKTVTGAIVHIMDAVAGPIDALSVAVEPVQNLHGYDNPWPAGGGKNLLDPSIAFGGASSTYSVNADGSVTVIASDGRAWTNVPEIYLPAGTYTIAKIPTTGTSDVRLSTESFEIGHIFTSQTTFTLSEAGSVKVKLAYSAQTYPSTQKVQIVSGTTVSAWTPYSNICPITGFDSVNIWVQPTHDTTAEPTATIQLGETVYGGTLDVVNGKMTVDSRYFVADGTNITTTGGYGAAGANWLPAIILPTGSKAAANAVNVLADSLKTSGSVQSVENSIAIGNSGAVIVLHIGTMQGTDGTHGYNSADEVHTAVKTYLQSNPIGIWYRLATHFELTLTPEQISTLQGVNNVWSDAGNVTMTYRASAS